MFIYHDLFPRQIQFYFKIFIITGTYKFSNMLANCYFTYCSLFLVVRSILLLLLLVVQDVLLLLSPENGLLFSSSRSFGPVPAFVRRWHSLANKFRAGRVLYPHSSILFPYIGLSGTNWISCPTSLSCAKASHRSGSSVYWSKTVSMGPSLFQFCGLWIEVKSVWGSDRRVWIQWLSFALRKLASSLWICSITKIERSSRQWPLELKWLATGFSWRRCLISDRWPFIRMWSAFSVSPTYCFLHYKHSIT